MCLNPDHQWQVGFDGDEDVYDIRYTEDFETLQPGDLLGVRLVYGPATEAETE